MPLHTCARCGRIQADPYCTQCRGKRNQHGRADRNRTAQRRFRTQVLRRDHYTCQDCGSTTNLRACHLTPVAAYLNEADAYHPSNGTTRCQACDERTDPYARQARTMGHNQ